KVLVHAPLRPERPRRQPPSRRQDRDAALTFVPLPIVGVTLQLAAMLGRPLLTMLSQLRRKVRPDRTAARHLQCPGRYFIGNILRASEGRLKNTVVIAYVNIPLGHTQLPGASRRQR